MTTLPFLTHLNHPTRAHAHAQAFLQTVFPHLNQMERYCLETWLCSARRELAAQAEHERIETVRASLAEEKKMLEEKRAQKRPKPTESVDEILGLI